MERGGDEIKGRRARTQEFMKRAGSEPEVVIE
jgi:hypothetical protein